jgi:hypothetical protein
MLVTGHQLQLHLGLQDCGVAATAVYGSAEHHTHFYVILLGVTIDIDKLASPVTVLYIMMHMQ